MSEAGVTALGNIPLQHTTPCVRSAYAGCQATDARRTRDAGVSSILTTHSKHDASARRRILTCVLWAGAAMLPGPRAIGQDTASTTARADTLPEPRLQLTDARDDASGTTIRHGTFHVWENRARQSGRVLELDVVVLPARGAEVGEAKRPDPVFLFAGGPGQNAAGQWRAWTNHWMRRERDIVLVSQRGTGGNNRLAVDLPADDARLQGYLDPIFVEAPFRAALKELTERFDLTQYSTYVAADDVNDLRIALGYDKINLYGGSYGSRAELVYIRQHGDTVRTAILNSVAPMSFKNPLHHARSAQDALDLIFDECAADPKCRAAFGDLRDKFAAVLKRLDERPAEATVRLPSGGRPQRVTLTREIFGQTLQLLMYRGSRDVPLLVQRAFNGDFDALAQRGMEANRSVRGSVAFGMLACVTCSEDVARIDDEEIAAATANTFRGAGRIRRQQSICRFWPKSELPADFAEPIRSDVPVLLFSGTLDPVTPPRFGEEAVRHLKHGRHVVVPGAHGVGGPCVESIMQAFLERGSANGLGTSCVETMTLPPFRQ